VPEEAAAALFAELVTQMREVRASPALLHDVVKAAAQLARSVPTIASGAGVGGKEWGAAVLAACDERIAPVVASRLRLPARSDSPNATLDDSAAAAADASASPATSPPEPAAPSAAAGGRGAPAQLIPAVFLVGALALEGVKVPTRLCNAVQALLTPFSVGSVGSSSSNGAPAGGASLEDGSSDAAPKATLEQELQGHVLVALGKIALQDSSLASKVASLFLRELEFSPSPVSRPPAP